MDRTCPFGSDGVGDAGPAAAAVVRAPLADPLFLGVAVPPLLLVVVVVAAADPLPLAGPVTARRMVLYFSSSVMLMRSSSWWQRERFESTASSTSAWARARCAMRRVRMATAARSSRGRRRGAWR